MTMYWQRHDDLNGAAATEQLYADHIGPPKSGDD